MYTLVAMMLFSLFLLKGINNVYSTLMEEMLVDKIFAEDSFMGFQNWKLLRTFSDGKQSPILQHFSKMV